MGLWGTSHVSFVYLDVYLLGLVIAGLYKSCVRSVV